MATKKDATLTHASEGEALSVVGDSYRIVKSGKDTGDDYAVIDMLIPPNGGPGPHAHKDFHETFYVIDGEIEVITEDGTHTAKKGDYAVIPKGGLVHSFKNKTQQVAHLWCMVVPAGIDAFFEEIGKPGEFGKFTPPPPMDEETQKKMEKIAEKFGQKLYPPDYLDKK